MTLNQQILSEIQKIDLNGISVLAVAAGPNFIDILFDMPPARVKFRVEPNNQFQVTGANYGDTTYTDVQHLMHFNSVVLHILEQTKINEIRAKIEAQNAAIMNQATLDISPGVDAHRLQAIIAREQRNREFEEQLDLKEAQIKEQEQILYEKESVIVAQRNAAEIAAKEKQYEKVKKINGFLRSKMGKKSKVAPAEPIEQNNTVE